ncbi:MAG: hypothetical protein IPG07_21900 [Crocinitomicaceae bacterium]|nr:hypothetical protein [Crocinitomicaceae bacterium]
MNTTKHIIFYRILSDSSIEITKFARAHGFKTQIEKISTYAKQQSFFEHSTSPTNNST